MRILLLIAGLTLSLNGFSQLAIITDTVLQLSPCPGGSVIIPYSTTGNFGFATFKAELSDGFGQFGNPVVIGSVPINSGIILGTFPPGIAPGLFYRIRVTSGAVIGTPSPNTVVITSVPLLNSIIAYPGTSICPGDSTLLTAISGAEFLWSNGKTTQSIYVNSQNKYWVKVTDFTGCVNYDTIEVYVVPCGTVGIEETAERRFRIFPNPATGRITAEINDPIDKPAIIAIYNSGGKMVLQKKLYDNLNDIIIESLAGGLYYTTIIHPDGHLSTQKLVVY